MPRDKPTQNRSPSSEQPSENIVTIVGTGMPTSFEITTTGDIQPAESNAISTMVSGKTAEGAIETGVLRFRFVGEMVNVNLVNRGGLGESAEEPHVHVDYSLADSAAN